MVIGRGVTHRGLAWATRWRAPIFRAVTREADQGKTPLKGRDDTKFLNLLVARAQWWDSVVAASGRYPWSMSTPKSERLGPDHARLYIQPPSCHPLFCPANPGPAVCCLHIPMSLALAPDIFRKYLTLSKCQVGECHITTPLQFELAANYWSHQPIFLLTPASG